MNQLTEIEIAIMDLFTSGFNQKEISEKLNLSTQVTNTCFSNIYKKLDSKNKYCNNTNI